MYSKYNAGSDERHVHSIKEGTQINDNSELNHN